MRRALRLPVRAARTVATGRGASARADLLLGALLLLIGTGVASATYPASRQPGSKALIRRVASGYEVAIGAADLGTGTWTALTQVAADALEVDPEQIQLAIGDALDELV